MAKTNLEIQTERFQPSVNPVRTCQEPEGFQVFFPPANTEYYFFEHLGGISPNDFYEFGFKPLISWSCVDPQLTP